MINERIKMLREQHGLSQAELAKKLNIARTSVIAWENQTSVPTIKHVVAIAKLFHITTDYLLEVEQNPTLSISDLNENELSILYKLLDYFKSRD
ncbi:MAG: helix-turn-helix transcriptional regulator [Ruminococcaceae bacterium]|nr:helix-turn-helix transcriptional regulator [Oscillospiraceae bacterium]